ncbi:MAG: calcium/sodium antiporter [Spirochaetes bacterium]|nr:calcium/sodium antiporter [Spirochaetota bacterium]
MMLDGLFLLIGFSLLIFGANILIEGGVGISRKYKISQSIVGLTIVAAGTSAPEYAVSFIGALSDKGNISIGNIVGSNILNIGFVLGLISMISVMKIKAGEIRQDILFLILTSIFLLLFVTDYEISHSEGFIFLGGFLLYIYFCYKRRKAPVEEILPRSKSMKISRIILYITGGIVGLFLGGKLTVDSSIKIARYLSVSETVISLSIVALGTSLPEFITSIMAVSKKHSKLSLGNIIGSNIFNILFCLGSSASIINLKVDFDDIRLDIYFMLLLTVLLFPAIKGNRIRRWHGLLFFALYVLYVIYLYAH